MAIDKATETATMHLENVSTDERVLGVAWAPDGRRALIGTASHLFLWQHIVGNAAVIAMPPVYAWPAAWAPDGSNRVISRARGPSTKCRVTAWNPLELADQHVFGDVLDITGTLVACAWAPNSSCVFGVAATGTTFTWNPSAGPVTIQPPAPFDCAAHVEVAWAPGGALVSVVMPQGIVVIDPHYLQLVRVLPYSELALGPSCVDVSWLSDSRHLRIARIAGGDPLLWAVDEPPAPDARGLAALGVIIAADMHAGIAAPHTDVAVELPPDVCGAVFNRRAGKWPIKLSYRPTHASWAPTGARVAFFGARAKCTIGHVAMALAAPPPPPIVVADNVLHMARSPSGNDGVPWLAVATHARVRIYSLSDNTLWRSYAGGVVAFAWRGPAQLLTIDNKGVLRIIDPWLEHPSVVLWPAASPVELRNVCIDASASRVAATDKGGALCRCAVTSSPTWERPAVRALSGAIVAAAWAGGDIVLVADDGQWAVVRGDACVFRGGGALSIATKSWTVRAAVSPDTRHIAFACRDEVRIFALFGNGTEIFRLSMSGCAVGPALAWTDTTHVSCAAEDAIHMIDLATDDPARATVRPIATPVRALHGATGCAALFVASHDGSIACLMPAFERLLAQLRQCETADNDARVAAEFVV